MNIIKNPYNNTNVGFVKTININNKVMLDLLLNKTVNSQYDVIGCIDMLYDSALVYKLLNQNSKLFPFRLESFQESLINYIREHVALYDIERCLNIVTYDNIQKQLVNNQLFEEVIDVINGNKINKKKIVFSYLDRDNQIIMFVQLDITSVFYKELESKRKINEALIALEQSNNAKSEFLARMSHEVRTPMNAIIGLLELGKNNLDDKEYLLDCFDKTINSSRYLLSIISDILDMTTMTNGNIKFHLSNVKFESFLNTITTIINIQAKKYEVNLRIINNKKDNDMYYFDDVRLQQVLINILSNAMKFTPKGGYVKFIIDETFNDETSSEFVFSISDTGIGISEEFMPNIFKPFTQEDNKSTTRYSGSGLGLSIAHNIIELMKGTISVTSKVGVGTTFTVNVRLPKCNQSGIVDNNMPTVYDFTGKRAMLVEDNKLNIMVAEKLLTSANMKVDIAYNGLEALELFKNSSLGYYDIILMDVRMPVMDGIDATKHIRSLNRIDASKVVIIATTANSFDEDKGKTLGAGMNTHLSKPIDVNILYKTIKKYLG